MKKLIILFGFLIAVFTIHAEILDSIDFGDITGTDTIYWINVGNISKVYSYHVTTGVLTGSGATVTIVLSDDETNYNTNYGEVSNDNLPQVMLNSSNYVIYNDNIPTTLMGIKFTKNSVTDGVAYIRRKLKTSQ